MKVLARIVVVLLLSLGLAAGGINTPAQADDADGPYWDWSTMWCQPEMDGFRISVRDCGWLVMMQTVSRTDGSTGKCTGFQKEQCRAVVKGENELWSYVTTWDRAQAALAGYGELGESIINDPYSFPGHISLAKGLLSAARQWVATAFDPVTHQYNGLQKAAYEGIMPDPDFWNEPSTNSFKTYVPTISGTPKVGKTLTVKVKTWNPKPSKTTYQWLRNGGVVEGATGSKYTLTAADLGAAITVQVTGTRSGYKATTTTSKATKAVVLGSLAKGKVKVTGTRRVGKTLTAKTSKWSSGVTYHYQWYKNGRILVGATDKTYVLSPADKGGRFKVKIWTTKDGYKTSSSRTSARTGKVKAGSLTKVTPVITGTAVTGETLTVDPGTWKPAETVFTYQWYKVSSKGKSYRIAGATSASFTVPAGMAGWRLKVKVTGKAVGYGTGSKESKYTAKVVDPTPSTPEPEPTPPPGESSPSPETGSTP